MDQREKRIATMQRRLEQFSALPRTVADPGPGLLPPGQSWVPKGFPVLDLGEHPEIDPDDWRLTIDGYGQVPSELDFASLISLPAISLEVDIHCVTAWSVPHALWLGVTTQSLREQLKLDPSVTHVMVYGSDGYCTNLSLEDFFAEDSLLAYGLNGDALSISHGGPVRLVVPHLYFWKSPKWISRLEFLANDRPGFWEQRGYHNRGNPWEEERAGKPISVAAEATPPLAPSADLPARPPGRWERVKVLCSSILQRIVPS